MHTKKVALAVLASALLSATALAQSSPPAGSASPPAASPPAATQPMKPTAIQSTATQGQWRASKLVGLNVYNANNEKIGDINELLTDSSGKINTIVVGVGGFLGMGEHAVGLSFDQVKFVNEPVRTSSTTTTTTTAPRTTGTGAATTTTTTGSANRDYPDHAMVNMTKDQLKALPAFKYASDTRTTTTSPATAPANRAPAPVERAPANPPAAPAPTAR